MAFSFFEYTGFQRNFMATLIFWQRFCFKSTWIYWDIYMSCERSFSWQNLFTFARYYLYPSVFFIDKFSFSVLFFGCSSVSVFTPVRVFNLMMISAVNISMNFNSYPYHFLNYSCEFSTPISFHNYSNLYNLKYLLNLLMIFDVDLSDLILIFDKYFISFICHVQGEDKHGSPQTCLTVSKV